MKTIGPSKFGLAIILIIIVAAGLLLLFKMSSPKPGKIDNVMLISIDTCRADYLSCYGYNGKTTPNIDAVAEEGILFENVVSPVPLTLPAHSSMLTGTIPPFHEVHDNLDYQLDKSNTTIAEILKEKGFATGGIVSAFILDSAFGMDQGFDTYNDRFEHQEKTIIEQRRGGDTSKIAIEWLQENKGKKFFLFLHYFDPHAEYKPPEPFASKFTFTAHGAYAGEIAYTDWCIGQVITKLKELKLYNSTLIVITSDHGEMLGEHGERSHCYFIYESAVKVPLIFKLPGRHKAKRIKHTVGLVDIVPTICGLMNIAPPKHIQGTDISGHFKRPKSAEQNRYFFCESLTPTKYNAGSLLGILNDRYKYIQTTRCELYDLVKYPAELNNLALKEPKRARIMKDELAHMIEASVGKTKPGSRVESDAETRKKLESLGYVGGTVSESLDFDQSKEDPKDLIAFHGLYMTVRPLIFNKEFDRAKIVCNKLIQQRPDSSLPYQNLADIAIEEADYPTAVMYLQKALQLKPDDYHVHYNLGMTLMEKNRLEEALRHFQRAMELKPDSAGVYLNFGVALVKAKRLDKALEYFYQSIKLDPERAETYYNLATTLKDLGKTSEAVKYFRQALRVNADYPEAHLNLGIVLVQQGKLDSAIDHFRRATQLKTDYTEALNSLGQALKIDGDLTEAESYFRKALRIDPENPVFHYNLALLLSQQNNTAQAAEHLNEAIRIQPGWANAHSALGGIYLQQQKPDLAVAHWKKTVELEPDSVQILNNLAWILATTKDDKLYNPKEALTFAKKACELTGYRQVEFLDSLSVAFAADGNFAQAVETAQKALQLAAAAGNNTMVAQLKERIELYKNSQPYRE